MDSKTDKYLTWANENLLGKSFYSPALKRYVIVDKSCIKHVLYSKPNLLKWNFIYEIPDVIELSKLDEIQKDKLNRAEILNVYRLSCGWKVNNEHYRVYSVIREKKDGCFYYDHSIIKKP